MALDENGLKGNLRSLFDATYAQGVSAADAETAFINGLADAITTFVKSGKVVYNNGLVAGSNPVTGTFNGSIQ